MGLTPEEEAVVVDAVLERMPPLAPPPHLRRAVLADALRRRPGVGLTPTDMRTLHRHEVARTRELLDSLATEDWSRPVDPPEFAGWTVKDLVSHLSANASLLAVLLGSAPLVPEQVEDNVGRTEATRARHRGMTVVEVADEYRRVTDVLDELAGQLGDDELEADVVWWGLPMRRSTALVVRTFETWTHADDIRRAVGRENEPPPSPSLATMSGRSIDWIPLMAGSTVPAVATLVLTGDGGGTYRAQLAQDEAPATAAPVFELELDVVDYCRAVAARLPEGGLPWRATGDREAAAHLVANLPALAQL